MTDSAFQTSFEVGSNSYDINLHYPKHSSNKIEHEALTKKYNLSIRRDDLILLEQIQSAFGESRTNLLNELLEKIMKRFLLSFKEGDARIELAEWADDESGVAGENESWVSMALEADIFALKRNYKNYNTPYDQCPDPRETKDYHQSAEYLAVKSKLEK